MQEEIELIGIILAFHEGGRVLVRLPGGTGVLHLSKRIHEDGTPLQLGDEVILKRTIRGDGRGISDVILQIISFRRKGNFSPIHKEPVDGLSGSSTTDAPPPAGDVKKKKRNGK